MLTITITSPEGDTITTDELALASGAMRRMLSPMSLGELAAHARLLHALDAENYLAAGVIAESLYLRLTVTDLAPTYVVPIDPANEFETECCQ